MRLDTFERTGIRTVAFARTGLSAAALAARTLRLAWEERGAHGGVLLRTFVMQVWFTGVQALPLVAVAALALGVIVVFQTEVLLSGISESGFVERSIVFILVRELPAIVVSLILIARSGTAITTEIATMKLNRDIETLTLHGIPPEVLVVLPRLAAFPVACAALTFYFILIAVGGGVLAIPLFYPHPVSFSFATIDDEIRSLDVLLPAAKAVLFGILTAILCAAQGLSVRQSPREVPQVATRGVTASFMTCLVANALLSLAGVQ